MSLNCPFLKVTYTAMNREIVAMRSCKMGIESSRIPEHCDGCTMNPENEEGSQ